MAALLQQTRLIGSNIHGSVLTNDGKVVGAAGNALAVTYLTSGAQELFETKCKRGINVIASSGDLVAFSHRDRQPWIYVFRNLNEQIAVLKDGPDLEYSCISVSKTGDYVAATEANLEQELFIWECKGNGSPLAKIEFGQDCKQISFSPLDETVICASGPDGVTFYQLRRTLKIVSLVRLSSIEVTGDESEGFLGHSWTKEGHAILVSKNGAILKIDPHTAKVLKTSESFAASSVKVIKGAVIIGTKRGEIKWLKDSNWSQVHQLELCPGISIDSLELSQAFDKCLAGSSSGQQFIFNTDLEGAAQVEQLENAHKGTAVAVAPIYSVSGNANLVASIGSDGTYRVWDISQNSSIPLVQRNLISPESGHVPPASISSSPKNPFVAVGNLAGYIETFHHFKPGALDKNSKGIETTIGHSFRAHSGPVSMLKFDPTGALLATGSLQDNTISIFRIPTSGEAPSLAAIVDLGESLLPLNFVWDDFDSSLLIASKVSSEEGDVAKCFRVLTSSINSESNQVATKIVPDPCGSFDKLGNDRIGDMILLSSGRVVTSISNTPGLVDVFEGPIMKRAENLKATVHEGGVWSFAKNPKSQLFASGSVDGSICLWQDAENLNVIQENFSEWSVPSSSVSSLCFAADCQHVVACHLDGTLTILQVRNGNILQPPTGTTSSDAKAMKRMIEKSIQRKRKQEASSKTSKSSSPSASNSLSTKEEQVSEEGDIAVIMDKPESVKWKQRAEDLLNQEFDRKKNERRDKVKQLQQRLLQLLENNQNVPELEKLEREEFVIDTKGKEKICVQNENVAEQLRKTIEREIESRKLIFERIKKECWDSMEEPSKQVHGLGKALTVRNFPIPKLDETSRRQLKRVKQIRTMEIREIRAANHQNKTTWDGNRALKTLPEEADWIVNAGTLQPITDHEAAEAEKKKLASKDASSKQDQKQNPNSNQNDDDDDDGEDLDQDADGEGNQSNSGASSEPQDGKNGSNATEDDLDREYSLLELLYHPVTLRSNFQMRNQVVLLKQVQREMMQSFNKRFESVVEQKLDSVERIASKYERINEILTELRAGEEPLPEFWQPNENPESVFEVSQAEIGVIKYLSKAEREKAAREEEERLRREAEAAKDNFGERALDEMMNGTLEAAKQQSLAEQDLERPQWMTEIEYGDMTDEQRREFDEFEVKYQKFLEEKEKYTKALELELKKLHAEVSDVMKAFDDVLEELARFKVDVIENVKTQGLYISRYGLSLLKQEDLDVRHRVCKNRIRETKQSLSKVVDAMNEFNVTFDVQKAELQEVQEADRAMERAFKVQIQEHASNLGLPAIDNETLRVFQQLYKQRNRSRRSILDGHTPDRKPSRSDSLTDGHDHTARRHSHGRRPSLEQQQLAAAAAQQAAELRAQELEEEKEINEKKKKTEESLDPYLKETKEEEEYRKRKDRQHALAPLDLNTDLPEGFLVEPPIWQFLQETRIEKIKSELELKEEQDKVATLQSHYDELDLERKALETTLKELLEKQESIITAKKIDPQNVEVIVRLKEGQDEVKPGVITDYSGSLLLHRNVIENENKEIVSLGTAKVGIMSKMKNFRKSINYMEWEHRYMEHEKHDFEEHYTDLHMLRVTRTLQEVIKGGEVSDRKEQTQQAESKLTKMKKIHESKMSKTVATLRRLEEKQTSLRMENAVLNEKINELRASVEMRDAVFQARSGYSVFNSEPSSTSSKKTSSRKKSVSIVGSGAAAAKAKMKNIVTRRKMTDLVRAQSDEIEFLRRELEELREKNFPKFSKPSAQFAEKGYSSHPDEKHK